MGLKRLSFIKNASYNTVGILIYDICLWLTTLAVVRLSSDYNNAGIWQLTISITNIFSVIAGFNLSTYYISDVDNKYDKSNYMAAQIVTCLASILLCSFYSFNCGYRGMQLMSVVLYSICRAVEAYAGFLFGIDQRNYRMDYVGISFSLRGLLDLIAFSLVLYIVDNVALASLSMVVVTLVLLVSYDIPKVRQFGGIAPTFSNTKIKSLLYELLPSVLSFAFITAISTIPRQFLEKAEGSASVGVYSTIAAPLIVFQVVSISAFNPILQDLAISYREGNYSRVREVVAKAFGLLAFFLAMGLVFAKILGSFAYTFIYGNEIFEYCYLMYAIIVSTILYAVCWIVFSLLIVVRKPMIMLVNSFVSITLTVTFGNNLISRFSMNGVSYTIIISYFIFAVMGCVYLYVGLKRKHSDV